MVIREMSRAECFEMLRGERLARLACANDNQPYIIPVYLGFDEATNSLYGFTTLGQKIEWMRINPKVCVEVDVINAGRDWTSVIATGRFEELTDEPVRTMASARRPERSGALKGNLLREEETEEASQGDARERAWQVLRTHPEWWEPGSSAWVSRREHRPLKPYRPIFYRIVIETITGHQAVDDSPASSTGSAVLPVGREAGFLGHT